MQLAFYNLNALLHTHLVYGLIFITALCIGSFLNVIIARLPRYLFQLYEQSDATDATTTPVSPYFLLWPRSHCQSCSTTLKAPDLIPVISYFLLRAKCRYCKTPLSLRYPLVELLCAMTVTTIFILYGLSVQTLAVAILSLFLISLGCIDLETGLLPDQLTLSGLWLGLLLSLNSTLISPQQAILGAALGYAFLSTINYFYFLFRKRHGMGMGDCKYLAMLGAWCGPLAILYIVLCASCIAILINLLALLHHNKFRNLKIAFGPYLSAATLFILLLRPG